MTRAAAEDEGDSEAPDSSGKEPSPTRPVAVLGIVFGDIGASPLFTLKTVLNLANGTPDRGTTLGVCPCWRVP